nr:hypothetical protein [Picobirnavirus sp.]
MTSNQINYRRLLEDKRHNRVQEAETKRANLISERLKREDQKIQTQYNAAHFEHNSNVLRETARHNLATENKDLVHLTKTLAETERHNVATEQQAREKMYLDHQIHALEAQIKQETLAENTRHNLSLEGMQATVNSWNYELGKEKNAMTAQSITNQYDIDSKRIAETQRANVQNTLLQFQRDAEQKRHNVTTERLTQTQNNIKGLDTLSSQVNSWYKTLSR